jgi:ATP-dependent DNA helicase RecQ
LANQTSPPLNSTELLNQHFGFEHFRPGQQQVVETILAGQSAAAIFPTGSGKSLCYQLPALVLPHLTLVVSPLLALMQDQLAFLESKGIKAASIDSTLTREQNQAVMQGVASSAIKILMISVERFNNERFRQFVAQIPISLLVVDEAHCISEWGHNFRPDYLKLPKYQAQFNIPQALLLTATATQQVIADMSDKFAIAKQHITTTGFYRPNLHINAKGVPSNQRSAYLQQWLADKKGLSGIIYVTLQQTAEQLAEQLKNSGINAHAYHAGMLSERRQQIQNAFMDGSISVIVATIAFGMGIDKSDIRFVAHYDLPKSIENYAQEIGRAGRDGNRSECLLLLNSDRLNVLENFIYADTPQRQDIAAVLRDIKQANLQWEVMLHSLSNEANIRLLALKTLLVYAELTDIVKPTHSYFAEYKFKFLLDKQVVLAKFEGERQQFLNSVFATAKQAKIWHTLDFEALYQAYNCDRSRVISALDYLSEKGFIELQSGKMTDVYQVTNSQFNVDELSDSLYQRFTQKEHSEIQRIQQMLNLFTSSQCLTSLLCDYFSDQQLNGKACGHCSVCSGNVASLPPVNALKPLAEMDKQSLTEQARLKLAENTTPVMLARFLCGLTTPLFTRLKMRQLNGFGALENYRFSDVLTWLEEHN